MLFTRVYWLDARYNLFGRAHARNGKRRSLKLSEIITEFRLTGFPCFLNRPIILRADVFVRGTFKRDVLFTSDNGVRIYVFTHALVSATGC